MKRYLMAALVAAAACSDGPKLTTPPASAVGRYGLTTVNDSILPRTIQTRTDYMLEITSDTIVMNGDGTWADGTLYRETSTGGVQSFSNFIGGSYTVTDAGVVTFSSNNGHFEGLLSGNTLTVLGTAKAVYRK